ncbi:hypothetical protein HGG78_01955 [Vibrio aestuarianus]|uniref:hypothetical protein n=1 Tax=Vibrio aestuarianus TaxID=28171 RepID=UPI0006A5E530|nr:hypothetical protein [Vibrio aestuarianus]KOE82834.1 hypothetical protein ACS86_08395 [Vibrio alginolyticus]MDE1332566.1 hypothetical protein [Vibrio aestuarianus]NGZ12536.1 hypothetical protein [Vibrio aestuarianus]NKZ48684.1 hypothetical protein [Vibrio aestuarianus]CAH8242315.1 conserved hypothetical protein [Vibrio aestuarianus]
MDSGFVFEWVFVSWIISLFIHHHNIKRVSILNHKDGLVDALNSISDLSWQNTDDSSFYQEERYNTKVESIFWKVKQLNTLASCELFPKDHLNKLYDFDIETFVGEDTKGEKKCELKFNLQETCDTIISEVEARHFNKVLKPKAYILWSARHSMAGLLFGLVVVYLFIQVMSFFFI